MSRAKPHYYCHCFYHLLPLLILYLSGKQVHAHIDRVDAGFSSPGTKQSCQTEARFGRFPIFLRGGNKQVEKAGEINGEWGSLVSAFEEGCDDEAEEITYAELRLEDMDYFASENKEAPYGPGFYYQCPCGDLFFITKEDLIAGANIARCPSCTLVIEIRNPESIINYTN
mmetsp:Transcript_4781/g.6344  ORF Transcript_4781/g.6344 Transcript_4781/m.6344 type:complete len:170 (+) Transcript_4781:43-552(+)